MSLNGSGIEYSGETSRIGILARHEGKDKTSTSTSDDGSSAVQKMLNEVENEIKLHDQAKTRNSYVTSVIDKVYDKDERSLTELTKLKSDLNKQLKNGDFGSLEATQKMVAEKIRTDLDALKTQEKINTVGRTLATTAPLFLGGWVGLAAVAVTFALDRARPDDGAKTQLLDMGLGVAEGLALKGIFRVASHLPGGIATRGVGLGMASRFTGLALDPQNYVNRQNGQFQLSQGLKNSVSGTFRKDALAVDALTWMVAGSSIRGANRLTGGLLNSSPFASTVLTGGTFGFTGGVTSELASQSRETGSISLVPALKSGLERAVITSLAATLGALQAQHRFNALQRQIPSDALVPQPEKQSTRASKLANHGSGKGTATGNGEAAGNGNDTTSGAQTDKKQTRGEGPNPNSETQALKAGAVPANMAHELQISKSTGLSTDYVNKFDIALGGYIRRMQKAINVGDPEKVKRAREGLTVSIDAIKTYSELAESTAVELGAKYKVEPHLLRSFLLDRNPDLVRRVDTLSVQLKSKAANSDLTKPEVLKEVDKLRSELVGLVTGSPN